MPPGTGRVKMVIEEEFQKNPDLSREDMEELRQWATTQKNLPQVSDQMLILFLHSCYYDMARTKSCMERYYTLRKNSPEFFSKRNVAESPLSQNISCLYCSELPGTDMEGNKMIYYSLRDFDPSKYVMADHMKVFLMTVDAMLAEHGTMSGLVVVFNLHGVRLGHLTRFNLISLRRFFQYIQEGNPVRLKKIHLINVMPYIDTFMTIFRPFLDKKFLDMLIFHTNNTDAFYECVPKKYLPTEADGFLDSAEVFTAENTKLLATFAEFFLEEEELRADSVQRNKQQKSKRSNVEPNISFEKLDID